MKNQYKPIEIFVHDAINDSEGQIHHVILSGVGLKGIGVGVGISITNPCDIHNRVLGETIAKGRAVKNPCMATYIMPKYPLTKFAVQHIVMAVLEDLKAHPDAFIGGFTKKVKKTKPIEIPLNGTIQEEKV